ncbi:MAG TPA: hypothetical protein VMQ99_12465 [Acetobacteraceae bacterium]|jgi:hypothetical protein|nr:hypothetical protein [Acetobacteraceae bacterium]
MAETVTARDVNHHFARILGEVLADAAEPAHAPNRPMHRIESVSWRRSARMA